jgi:hypothetical protein
MKKAPDINRLSRARNAALGGMPAWTEIIRGSLTRYYLTCGKASCRCHRSKSDRHGPYWYLSVPTGKGRNKSYLLAAEQVPVVRQATAAYRRLWKALCHISNLNLALLRAGSWREDDRKRTRQ